MNTEEFFLQLILGSGTRREELLMDKEEMIRVWILRKLMSSISSQESMKFLLKQMKETRDFEGS